MIALLIIESKEFIEFDSYRQFGIIETNQDPFDIPFIDTGYSTTWRQHAIHWGEPIQTNGGWQVWGYHYLYDNNGGFPFDTTYATDCSIYDGW